MQASPRHRLITSDQLGRLLTAARKKRSMTQTDVALRLGLSQNRVSYLEAHADAVSVKQLLTWCAALGLDLELGERTQPAADPAAW